MRHTTDAFAGRFDRQRGPFEGPHGHGGGPRGGRRGGPPLERLAEMAEVFGEQLEGGRRGRGRGGPGGRDRGPSQVPDASGAAGWFAGRLPDGMFTGAPSVSTDRDELVVVGMLAAPGVEGDATDVAAAEAGRISRFREETRETRIAIAQEAQARFGRLVSWGATCGGTTTTFTTASVPVMTRLRQSERQVLDTLVEAGVARSRSDALVWAIRLVGQNTDTWLADLRTALEKVQEVRAQGPQAVSVDDSEE